MKKRIVALVMALCILVLQFPSYAVEMEPADSASSGKFRGSKLTSVQSYGLRSDFAADTETGNDSDQTAPDAKQCVHLSEANGYEAFVPLELTVNQSDDSAFLMESISWKLHMWVSREKMGDTPSDRIQIGDAIYLCYRIEDTNGNLMDTSQYGWNYTATEYIYNTDGSLRHSYQYSNSNNNWIGVTYGSGSTTGVQRGKVVITGDISNTLEGSWTLYDTPVSISTHPKSVFALRESTAQFSVQASGTHLAYQWYYATSSSGTGYSISGANAATYSVSANASNSGRYYYCKVSNYGNSVDSTRALLTTQYYIYFNANGGSVGTGTKTVSKGGTYGELPVPSWEGHQFDGWFTASEGGQQITAGTVVNLTEDQTLYAHWKTFSLSYNANNGSGAPSSQNGTSFTIASGIPTRFGYDFLGWSKSQTASSPSYYPGNTITVSDNTTLYAVWRSASTVTLSSLPKNTTVSMNLAGAPRYLRFTPSGGGKYTFQSTGSNDTVGTLYDSSGNQLIANDDGGENRNFLITYDLTAGTTYYLRVSMYSSSAAPGDISIAIGTQTHTVNFDVNGGSGSPAGKRLTNGEIYGALPSVGREGYEFIGWFTAPEGGEQITSGTVVNLTADQTLYAHWKEIILTYNANGGAGAPSSQSGKDLTIAAGIPTRFGFDFLGWSKSQTASTPSYYPGGSISLTSGTTLYAVWREAANVTLSNLPKTVTVSMNLAGAARYLCFTPSESGKYTFQSTGGNDTIGYLYNSNAGQLVSNDDGGESRNFLITYDLTAGETYYLRVSMYSSSAAPGNISITLDKLSHTVIFNANGGTVTPGSKTVINGETYGELPEPVWAEHQFDGWFTAADGGTQITGETTVNLSGNQTLYAHWTKENSAVLPSLAGLSYSFQNSYSGFGYTKPYYIPYKQYSLIFGNNVRAKALHKLQYLSDDGWGGNCYGMSTTTGMFFHPENGIDLTAFRSGALTPSNLSVSDRNNAWNLSLTEFIEAMQASQYADKIQQDYENNTDLEALCQAVNAFAETGENPVVIAVMKQIGNSKSGHALVGYKIERVSASTSRLMVYDCNYPNTERYITLSTNSSGAYTGWYYCVNDVYDWGSAYENCSIAYIPYSDFYQIWQNRGNLNAMCTFSVNTDVMIRDMDGNAVASIQNGKLFTGRDDILPLVHIGLSADGTIPVYSEASIMLPADLYTVERLNTGGMSLQADEPLEATMMHVEQSASITTTSTGKIIFAVDDESGINYVGIEDGQTGSTYDVQLNSTLAGDHEDVHLTGTVLGKVVVLAQTSGSLNLNGVTGSSAKLFVDGVEVSLGGISGDVRPVISFVANGGSDTMSPRTADENGEVVLPVCSFTPPDGCVFRAWKVNGNEYLPGEICAITENTAATALWSESTEMPFVVQRVMRNGEAVRVTVMNQNGSKALLMAATYAPSGKMLDCVTQEISISKGASKTYQLPLAQANQAEVRVFLLDRLTYQPLGDSRTLK